MPVDASIYSLLKPPIQVADPMEQYGKTLGIQSLIGQQGLQDLQTQQIRKGIADDAATEQAFRESGGDLAKARDLLYGRGLYKPAQAADKNLLDAKKTQGDITKTALESLGKSLSIHRDGLANVNDPQAAAQWVMAGFNDPLLSPIMQRSGSPQEAIRKIPTDPQGFQQWKMQNGLGIEKFMEMTAPKQNVVSLGGKSAMVETNAMAPGFNPNVDLTHTAPPANPGTDMVLPDGAGNYVPNAPLIEAKKGVAKAGATNVNVKTDVKTGESLAGQVGPMMKDSTAIAEGAVRQVDAAQRIVKAVDDGKIFAGPLASKRLLVSQVGQILGVGGKDDAEKIANTSAAVRGLAELTLQGRQQMRGQGAITESEGQLAEKAMSGDIENLTVPEIRQLAKASERAARFNYSEHQRKLEVMKGNPALNQVAPFYQGPAMSAEIPDKAAPAPGGGVLTPNPDGSFNYGSPKR